MSALGRALWAEILKTRRTLALWLAALIPLGVVLLQFALFNDRGVHAIREGHDPWFEFIQQTLIFWALLALPLFITLETALLGSLEHRNNQWKHLLALPLPRWAVYVAKQASGLVLNGLCLLTLSAAIALAGQVLRAFRPEIGFGPTVPWLELIQYVGLIYLASWLLVSIQTWVAMRWPSFALASAVGVVMTVSGVMVINAAWGRFYPWALPALLFSKYADGAWPLAELLVGSLGGLIVAAAGCWEFTRRDVL